MNVSAERKFHLTGHSGSVYTIIQEQNSNTFLSAGSEGIVVKWSSADYSHPTACAKVKGHIFALLFLPDKNHLVIGTMYGSLYVIDLNSKQEIHHITFHQQSIYDIRFFDSKIFVCSKDGVLSIWDTEYHPLKSLKISTEALRQIDFSHSHNEIAIGASDHHIYILSSTDFSLQKILNGPANSVFSICFSPDGKYLLTGSRDAHLYQWNVNENYSLLQQIPAHLYTINHIIYICNDKLFATASRDKTIKLWDAKTFELKRVLDKEKDNGHINSVNKLLWDEKNHLLISTGDDRSIMGWQIQC